LPPNPERCANRERGILTKERRGNHPTQLSIEPKVQGRAALRGLLAASDGSQVLELVVVRRMRALGEGGKRIGSPKMEKK